MGIEAATRASLILLLAGGCMTTPLSIAPMRIVFSSARENNTDLYMVNMDGSGLRRLTTDPAADEFGRCSPDGRFIVFRRGGGETGDLYRMDLATGQELRLTDDPTRDSSPTWSPDGRFIYFAKRKDGFDRIARMRADGGDLRYLTHGEWHDVVPSVSPSGRFLAFHTYRYGEGSDIEVMDLRSGESRRVTHVATGYDYEPSFVTNDDIIFSSNRDGQPYRLYSVSLKSGETRMLADVGADAWGARYSATTREVVFGVISGPVSRILRTPPNGGEATVFMDDGYPNRAPDWCRA